MENAEAEKLVDQHVDALMEHFGSVQILVSWQSDGGDFTMGVSRGAGSYYARLGLAHEFIERERASVLARTLDERGLRD